MSIERDEGQVGRQLLGRYQRCPKLEGFGGTEWMRLNEAFGAATDDLDRQSCGSASAARRSVKRDSREAVAGRLGRLGGLELGQKSGKRWYSRWLSDRLRRKGEQQRPFPVAPKVHPNGTTCA